MNGMYMKTGRDVVPILVSAQALYFRLAMAQNPKTGKVSRIRLLKTVLSLLWYRNAYIPEVELLQNLGHIEIKNGRVRVLSSFSDYIEKIEDEMIEEKPYIKATVKTDEFRKLPLRAQALYIQLAPFADEQGVINFENKGLANGMMVRWNGGIGKEDELLKEKGYITDIPDERYANELLHPLCYRLNTVIDKEEK